MDSVRIYLAEFFINNKFDKEIKFYIIYLDNMMKYLDIF